MNITINPIHFNPSNSNFKRSDNKKPSTLYQSKDLIYSYNFALALKNQILFTAKKHPSATKEKYQEVIDKYNLQLSPKTLEEIFSPQALNNSLKVKQARKGARAFKAFSRYTLHKEFPIKSEGELTSIIPSITRERNKARILKTLIPQELLKNNPKKSQTELYGQYFNLLLATIINEGGDDGYKNAQKFLDDFVAPILIPPGKIIENNEFEDLKDCIEAEGKDYKDIYIKSKISYGKCKYSFYYKDMLLHEVISENYDASNSTRKKGIKEVISKIKNKEIDLNQAGNNKPYKDYRYPDKNRVAKLEDFQEKYGLNFKDINLLHQVFVYGTYPDYSVVAHPNSYEILEFVGDAVLDFCGKELLERNLEKKQYKHNR